jgi:hypothetical protein
MGNRSAALFRFAAANRMFLFTREVPPVVYIAWREGRSFRKMRGPL